MALKRLVIDGYGQVELNNVTFRRDGNIEAQCAFDGTDFESVHAENGMLLAVDKANRTLRLPDEDEKCPIALNYTSEHIYDERTPGLKNFYSKAGEYGRMGFLKAGETFTSNCLAYDTVKDGSWSEDTNVISALENCKETPVYGGTCENGAILLSATAPENGPVLKVVKKTTMPDGQLGVKFQVVKA